MQITNNTNRVVTTHYQTIDVVDGPVISAGDSYVQDTNFRVERVKINHLDGKLPLTVKCSGPRVNAEGVTQKLGTTQIEARHELVIRCDQLPDEIVELLDSADIAH